MNTAMNTAIDDEDDPDEESMDAIAYLNNALYIIDDKKRKA